MISKDYKCLKQYEKRNIMLDSWKSSDSESEY